MLRAQDPLSGVPAEAMGLFSIVWKCWVKDLQRIPIMEINPYIIYLRKYFQDLNIRLLIKQIQDDKALMQNEISAGLGIGKRK